MFIPNTSGMLSQKQGDNKFGEPVFLTPISVSCSIIDIRDDIKKTAIRTDSSASRANADELVAQASILFAPGAPVANGDKFVIAGFDLRIIMVQPVNSVFGVVDHQVCSLEAWAT